MIRVNAYLVGFFSYRKVQCGVLLIHLYPLVQDRLTQIITFIFTKKSDIYIIIDCYWFFVAEAVASYLFGQHRHLNIVLFVAGWRYTHFLYPVVEQGNGLKHIGKEILQ